MPFATAVVAAVASVVVAVAVAVAVFHAVNAADDADADDVHAPRSYNHNKVEPASFLENLKFYWTNVVDGRASVAVVHVAGVLAVHVVEALAIGADNAIPLKPD